MRQAGSLLICKTRAGTTLKYLHVQGSVHGAARPESWARRHPRKTMCVCASAHHHAWTNIDFPLRRAPVLGRLQIRRLTDVPQRTRKTM